MQNILSVQELSASYSKTGSPDFSPILHNVSIQVHKGELTCLCGLNGSGKSTFLQVLQKLLFIFQQNPVQKLETPLFIR